jgi:hypothetical protein
LIRRREPRSPVAAVMTIGMSVLVAIVMAPVVEAVANTLLGL